MRRILIIGASHAYKLGNEFKKLEGGKLNDWIDEWYTVNLNSLILKNNKNNRHPILLLPSLNG